MAKSAAITRFVQSILLFAGILSLSFGQSHSDSVSTDTMKIPINDLESKVRSTLMFGGSSPVSFSGEGRMKLQYHEFMQCPDYARADRSWTESNWEGNEDMLRIGMVVRASRNTVLWSKIGFQNTLPGITSNANATPVTTNSADNYGMIQDQTRHDKLEETATIHEDMCAGLAIRTIPASFWLKMGNILWTEASPLTIWKAQPRNTGWDFLPYEIEQPINRYYDYNIAKGAKEGRASWNKKALNGIDLESINLPWDLYLNAIYGIYERYDSDEREFVDWSNDIAYAGDWPQTQAKQRGVGNTYNQVFHLRLAKNKLFDGMTIGINYMNFIVQDDIKNNPLFSATFFGSRSPYINGASGTRDTAFYKQPQVVSVDVKGPVNSHLDIQADLALSVVDSTLIRYDSVASHEWKSASPLAPAFYGHLKSTYALPANLDVACITKDFYSPMSFAAPTDAFFPFGANLLGAGKFLARGEASPYAQNMAGALVSIMPDLGSGHFKLSYGQHFQLQTARDLIFFPYRLNGQDYWSLFQSSYNRWGIGLFDAILPARYAKRLGDESYPSNVSASNTGGPDAGGIRQDYLSTYEGFVPYESASQAAANSAEKTTIFTRSVNVPQHRKYTFNLELDASYDLGPLVGYNKDFYISGYGAINGVSTEFTPIALSQKNQQLWSWYVRSEPAFEFSDKFYLIGMIGFENWRADNAYMNLPVIGITRVPINYYDYAYGIGFDWEMASRVGLHTRIKWMQHEDLNYTDNNWATPIISSEIKMWF